MKYAIVNQHGTIEVKSDSSGETPADGVSLTDEQYNGFLSGTLTLSNGAIITTTPPSHESATPTIWDQIENESMLALRSGALYELIELAMREFMKWAQEQNPAVTEADLLNPASPYYSVGYVKNKAYRDRLLALMVQK